MQQYLDLIRTIGSKGTRKPAARENMPGTLSLFGHQFRHDLADGFPALTTKKIHLKSVVAELIWFATGNTNIKYLVDNGVNIWNEDAYNYYKKIASKNTDGSWNSIYMPISKEGGRKVLIGYETIDSYSMFTFEEFVSIIKGYTKEGLSEFFSANGYTLGDCGFQYGRVWRAWEGTEVVVNDVPNALFGKLYMTKSIDQLANVINSLKTTPDSRRHIITAIDPAHDNDLALYWCHAMFQFNCRPLDKTQRLRAAIKMGVQTEFTEPTAEGLPASMILDEDKFKQFQIKMGNKNYDLEDYWNYCNVPTYCLDCQLYQRSADVVLGVPFNIASYALLTHIIAKICNMVPGDFIHSFGDVHIYDNHTQAVDEQLSRTPTKLPTLRFSDNFEILLQGLNDGNYTLNGKKYDLSMFLSQLSIDDFIFENYEPQSRISAKLSTGLK